MDANKPDHRLLYELNMCRRKFDLEIAAAEHQLASVKRRLKSLSHDLYVYLAFLGAPVVLYIILNAFSMIPTRSILYILIVITKLLILCVYVIMLPANIYHLTKAIMLLRINRESEIPAELPLLEGMRKGEPAPQETSYRSEYDKLLLVLSRYYLNQDKLNQLHKKIDSPSCEMTLAELKIELMQLPVYEDIQPANPFTSSMEKLAKRKTKWIMLAIILIILLSAIIAVFA